jgi:hypothetical protein
VALSDADARSTSNSLDAEQMIVDHDTVSPYVVLDAAVVVDAVAVVTIVVVLALDSSFCIHLFVNNRREATYPKMTHSSVARN